MTERKYLAYYDTGRDCLYFIYYSEYRVGSRANTKDFRDQIRSRKGYSYASRVRLIDSYRIPDDFEINN